MDLMRPTVHRLSRSEISVDVETRTHVDNDPDDPDQVDIGCDVRSVPDAVPVMFDNGCGAVGLTCGRSDETAGGMLPRLAIARIYGAGVTEGRRSR